MLGVAIALAFGLDPLFGVLAGSVTLTGGPATGLAFAPLFEAAGVTGAASIAVAMAMAGIVSGALTGSPVATWLIHRHGLQAGRRAGAARARRRGESAPRMADGDAPAAASGEDDDETYPLLKNVIALLLAMWAGSWVSAGFAHAGITLPAYIGAMLVAALFRNLDDHHRLVRALAPRAGHDRRGGAVAVPRDGADEPAAVGTRRPRAAAGRDARGAGRAGRRSARLFVFGRMGRDYEAAVMSGGFIGFMLGTTANAMAVMRALVERYGPAPRAFLVAPLVGAFFLDFINALLITAGINLLR